MDELVDLYKRKLIGVVRDRPIIWDPRHRDYQNHEQRVEVWRDIENILNNELTELPEPKQTAKEYWGQLMRGYCNILKKRKDNRAVRNNHWKFETELQFLLPIKKERSSGVQFRNTPYNASFAEPVQFTPFTGHDNIMACRDSSNGSTGTAINSDNEENENEADDNEENENEAEAEDVVYEVSILNEETSGKQGVTVRESESSVPATVKSEIPAPVVNKVRTTPASKVTATNKVRTTQASRASLSRLRESLAKKRKVIEHSTKDGDEDIVIVIKKDRSGVDEETPRFNFLKSLAPMVEDLTEEEFLDFQMMVISDLRRKKSEKQMQS